MKYPQVVSMPSAVTNWLEEQLEARGIDADLYSRYVLSLLHTHTVDVIYSDEDLPFSPLTKESRRSGGGRKRFRRSSEWWKHAHLDAEKLKRSAAVQCLMSASDQNCEIESLVDELCEKLKETEDPEHVNPAPTQDEKQPKSKKVSPKEQAEKYYAAFPALRRDSPAKLISLIPKWIQSPKKKPGVRKPKGRLDSESGGSSMKNRGQGSKQRHGYLGGRGKKDHYGLCRNLANSDTVTNWDASMFAYNCSSSKKQRTRKEQAPASFLNSGFEPEKNDQCVVDNGWNNDEDINMYDDLPVNIRELLDSPTPPDDEDYSVEMMNMANTQDKLRDTMKSNFISGNLISSIWSNNDESEKQQLYNSMDDIMFDNRFNSVLDEESVGLDRKFRSITIEEQDRPEPPRDLWRYETPTAAAQNETNAYFERHSRAPGGSFLEGFHSLPAWSDATDSLEDECFENEHLLNRVAVSLMKINHNKEKSCFAEIVPTGRKPQPPPQPQSFHPFSFENSGFFPGSSRKDDLLTSERSHFRPINEKLEAMRNHGEYADGATFVISNNLDKVNYKRSQSGSMYLETEMGQSKKYCELYLDESVDAEFVLKFSVCQNDKACQTEENDYMEESGNIMFGSSKCEEVNEDLKICTCPLTTDYDRMSEDSSCAVHPERPESIASEVMWRYDTKSCDKCNNNTVAWNADWPRNSKVGSEWDNQNLRNIWSGGEVCHTCLNANGGGGGRPPPDANLREDISQDGEQLLSDLSSVQKCYRDDLPLAAEVSCDIADFFVPKERKRRHSYITTQHVSDPSTNSRSSWSFASRLEEDCLIQMSTIPTLRSVTL